MFPGLTTKCSEEVASLTTTITPKNDIYRVTSTATTTVCTTIRPPYEGFSGVLLFVNDSGGNISLNTGGNIEVARTVPDNMLVPLVYSKLSGKWYPGAIS